MLRARSETLRAAGLQQSDTFKDDLSFVLHSVTLRFHTRRTRTTRPRSWTGSPWECDVLKDARRDSAQK